jgi:hypothetical protein
VTLLRSVRQSQNVCPSSLQLAAGTAVSAMTEVRVGSSSALISMVSGTARRASM